MQLCSVNEFKKTLLLKTYYMPVWTRNELEYIENDFPRISRWLERYLHLGGVPQYVVEITDVDAAATVRDAARIKNQTSTQVRIASAD